MNTKTLLTVKIDKKLKKEAQKVAEELGIPLGTYINMNLKQFVREKEVKITGGYTASPALARSLRQIEKEISRGEIGGRALSVKELAEQLGIDH